MKKSKGILFLATAALSLAACSSGLTAGTTEEKESGSSKPESTSASTEAAAKDLLKADSIDVAHVHNNRLTLTYNNATPITMPDGSVVNQGDLKPIWQYISDQVGVQVNDVALQDAAASEYIELQATNGFTEADIYSGNVASSFMRYGQEGYFLNLKERLDDMPSLKKYFEENPSIEKAVTAPDGGIYYVPYVQELGHHAMVFFGREAWVTSLLDSTDQHEAETGTITTAYQGYWDERNEKNVVQLQNAAGQAGTLDRDTALSILLDYIKETYPDLEKPSDLYLGAEAQYDIDELVALWRVIKVSPNTLSKVTTGQVVEGALTTPFFVRSSGNHANYLMRFANYFGGQIIYGVDGESYFYLNEDGELTFSLNEPGSIEAFSHMRDIYKEGLIYEEIANENNEDNFRNVLYGSDADPNNKQFGFMTLDWIASTAAATPNTDAMLPPVSTFSGHEDEFVHYIGGSRPLESYGWAISSGSSEEEVNAALTLSDYMFSKEGASVFNFGTPDMLVEGETFKGPDGLEYPKINQWMFDQAAALKNNDLMMFEKEFLGMNLQLPYPKSIGVEYQFTTENGLEAWDLYQNNGVLQPSYDATENLLKITPTVWPINEQQQARIDQTNIGTEQRDLIRLYIMNSSAGPQSEQELLQSFEQGNLDTYVKVYEELYQSMPH